MVTMVSRRCLRVSNGAFRGKQARLNKLFAYLCKVDRGETRSRHLVVGRSYIIKEKGRQILSRLVSNNRRQTVGQLTAQCEAGLSTSVSEHTAQWSLLDMGLHSSRPTRGPMLNKCYCQLRLVWAQKN
ncbi:transposable element Tc1 transposase [Trichonephila clavipes]|nr:transposable element Tc1 transposase [Trichonephila clavipes]